MEKNVEVRVIVSYKYADTEEIVPVGKKIWLTDKESYELGSKGVIRILKIIKK